MSEPFNNPFAKLAKLVPPKSSEAAAEPTQPANEPTPRAAEPAAPAPKGPARAVVRLEKKGRGGKEVTVVEKLGLPPAALETWVKALKQALGSGGHVEGENLVLNGDQRSRLPALLTARGVRKITMG